MQMKFGIHSKFLATCLFLPFLNGAVTAATLDESCVINILNRTVQVSADGGWSMPNVPSSVGRVRARATCIRDGQTTSGQTDFFTIQRNGITDVGEFFFDVLDPPPSSIQFGGSGALIINGVGSTADLGVTATYPDGSTADVTQATSGINYTSSNPNLVSVDENGQATGQATGGVLVTARLDGVVAVKQVTAVSGGDADVDGLPDDYEQANGLNPNDPVDAHEDQDGDGLTALEEFNQGTDPNNADSDGDTIEDGEEVVAGDDGFVTNPLNPDSDNDGLRDALEILIGSSPVDPADRNLAEALTDIVVSPANMTITYNTVLTEASQQATVTGLLIDGNTIDLTPASAGTNYATSDVTVCSFGLTSGEIFAGVDGTCTVTATNSGLSDTLNVVVRTFTPTALSYVDIPGYANNVDVSGDYAFVAAGSRGLQVVSLADRLNPVVVAELDTPGNANDVKLSGNNALVADGNSGLRIIDVSDPLSPIEVGVLNDGSGTAWDVVSRGPFAYVANGASGLRVVDIGDPANPVQVGTVATGSTAKGVAISDDGELAVVAIGTSGIQTVDLSDVTQPTILGSLPGGDARDVVLSGNVVHVADYSSSYRTVDVSDPTIPVALDSVPPNNGGFLTDVAVTDRLGFGADVFFVNGVPILDIEDPALLIPVQILDFSAYRDDNGTGIALDSSFVYLTAARGIAENGASGTTRLYIGQFLSLEDTAGIPPVVDVVSPEFGTTVVEGSSLSVVVSATDDITVAAVNLLVDGAVMDTRTSAPYQFTYEVPIGITGVTLSAEGIDLAGNVGESPMVVVNVEPDPGTSIIGVVVDTDGVPLGGADVDCLGIQDTTLIDGSFTINDAPTASGAVYCDASLTVGSANYFGRSVAVLPVPDGTTDVGEIRLGAATYFGYNPSDAASIKLTSWTDSTNYELVNLDTDATVESGVLDRFDTVNLGASGLRYFKVEASSPLHATLGYDCCNYGGSLYYPTTDGRKMVGRDFVFKIPVLSGNNIFAIHAFEDSVIEVRNSTDTLVFATTLTAGNVYATSGSPLARNTVYHLTATGDVALQSSSRNAHSAVPARNGTDVGKEFMFHNYTWSQTGVAIFGYEDADYSIVRANDGVEVYSGSVSAQGWIYLPTASNYYRLTSTGNIGVWAGSTEGGGGISYMGDDLTQNTGDSGREVLVHSQTQGAYVFALLDNTAVTIDGTVTTLHAGDYLNLGGNRFYRITTDKPVIVQTIGGNGLNDWETELKLVP